MPQKRTKSSFKYIAFEGIDGSGKSTQAALFVDYLRSKGFKVFFTKEPGGKINDIRNMLLDKKWPAKVELFLFLADRVLTSDMVRGKVEDGFMVVSDRSLYSTLAYQGYGEGFDIEFLVKLNLFSTNGLKPDLIFCLDINLETMKKRLNRFDAIESKSEPFFERVRSGYIELSKRFNNFFLIDGEKSKEIVFEEIVNTWENL